MLYGLYKYVTAVWTVKCVTVLSTRVQLYKCDRCVDCQVCDCAVWTVKCVTVLCGLHKCMTTVWTVQVYDCAVWTG